MKSDDFPFVYVNQDGTVRELCADEKAYLSQEFHGSDGGRPYIKDAYNARDGWGSLSGFLQRSLVPVGVDVRPVNPDYVTPASDIADFVGLTREKYLERQRAREDAARL